ncbi:MAG: UvrD-helicase domain-containing protein [Muribaculum sp.]|nr:UvrD-helicase domain-containing protein [Muribaculum sp.]
MLKLQRASAGSGKTYTLARTYLQLFLTITEGGRTRLRTRHEINDAISHILAVTFTNKATDEMKDRIVSRLAQIADADLSVRVKDWPDYLEDFALLTGNPSTPLTENALAVKEAAAVALRTLLFNYSDFNVSTIDSFFQTILRTFAYETDLNDSYQLEIDASQTISAGVDATLDSLLQQGAEAQTSGWITTLMDRAIESGNAWNPYQKSTRRGSVYRNLLDNARKLESEVFKEKRSALDKYFSSNPDLLGLCTEIDDELLQPVVDEHDKLRSVASQMLDAIKRHNVDTSQLDRYLIGRLTKATGRNPFPVGADSGQFSIPEKAQLLSKGGELPAHVLEILEPLHSRFKDTAIRWNKMRTDPALATWGNYRKLIPYLPLLHIVAGNIHDLLSRQNSMLLSETNSLLHKIIDEDETPFIYERLGSRVNHYLIDEFQDTSRLQWINFKPLLAESLSYDYDNLIIGDAKQSIYRFRNADPSLITHAVTADLGAEKVREAGHTPAENTNHRSLKRIVEFNNALFESLAAGLDAQTSSSSSKSKTKKDESAQPRSDFFKNLYSNVRQEAKKTDDSGYVKITFYKNPKNEEKEEAEADSAASLSGLPPQYSQAGEFVASLLDRGFEQKDIAYLVRTNREGLNLVKAFMDYNSRQGPDGRHIEFISDESLLISNARSVNTIIGILEAIVKGYHLLGKPSDESVTAPQNKPSGKPIGDEVFWTKIKTRYEFLASKFPDESPAEILNRIFSYDKEPSVSPDNEQLNLSNLLGELQSVALPSLVEAFTAHFVTEQVRKKEAPFISAFQDAVLEYCENSTTDISSFLDWWHRKGSKLSISSPEGLDAVKIMTVHKSKGLQFDCVILPSANYDFAPPSHEDKMEWDWVKPDPAFPYADRLPPFIPIGVTKNLESTAHSRLYEDLKRKVEMDALNLAYVAMTRAVKELYVFSAVSLNKNNVVNRSVLGPKLHGFCTGPQSIMTKINPPRDLNEGDINGMEGVDPEENINDTTLTLPMEFVYGTPLTREEIKGKDDKDKNKDKKDTKDKEKKVRIIDEYSPSFATQTLKYKPAESSSEEEEDPRTTGNILHDIMSAVKMPEDVETAVRRAVVRGIISEERGVKISAFLQHAITETEDYGWFASGQRVINERALVASNALTRRPDRMLLDDEGNLTIVDYKFGDKSGVKKYEDQVAEYMELAARTKRFRSIKGYLWYVTLHEITPIQSTQETE